MTIYDRKPPQNANVNPQAQGQPVKPTALPTEGPLAKIVRQAQAGAGQQNWAQVAEQVGAEYRARGGKVSSPDLLTALRQIPDSAAQEQLISQLGGQNPQELRAALAQTGAAARPGMPMRAGVRLATPGGAQVKESKDAASGAGSGAGQPGALAEGGTKSPKKIDAKKAPKKVPRTTKAGEKAGAADLKTSGRVQANTTSNAAKSQGSAEKATLSQKGKATQPSSVKGKAGNQASPLAGGATQAQSGKAGQATDLKVIAQDTVAGLGVKLNPTWQQGDRLVFDPKAFRSAEQQVQQAVALKQKGEQAPQTSPLEQGATKPEKAPAFRLPSATIRASELKQHEQHNRRQNEQKLSGVVATAHKARASISSVQAKAAPAISAAQKGAESQITAALTRTLGQIKTAEQSARATVTARASAAQATITSAHQTAVQGIKQDTTQKIAQLKQMVQTLKGDLSKGKTKLNADVRNEFTRVQGEMRSAGQSVAGTARSIGQSKAAAYRSEALPKQGFWEKLANGDDYYEKKRQAKVNAALDVSGQYADGMVSAGNDQAQAVMKSLPDALQTNDKLLEEYNKKADDYLRAKTTALQQQQSAALAQANAQKASLISQVNQQKTQALTSIGQAASQGRSQATAQANSRKQAVRQQGQQALANVRKGAQQASAQMGQRIGEFEKGCRAQLDQDAPDFAKAIAGFEKYAANGSKEAQAQVMSGATAAAAKLKGSAAPAVKSLGSLGQRTASSLKAQATQSGQALSALGSSGKTSLQQVLTGHRNGTKKTLDTSKTELRQFNTSFTTDAGKVLEQVKTQLGDATKNFSSELGKVLTNGSGETKAEAPAIEEAAQKAADAVKPRWKAWVSVIIDVVIAIATIAAIVALGAVLGPVGLLLAGMAIGALGAVVGQALKDAVNGEFSGWKAYGAAAVGGAIGGAFGGAGGMVGNVLAKGVVSGIAKQGLGKLAQGAVRVGVESAIGTGFDLAGQVVTGYTNQKLFDLPYKLSDTFNAKNIAMTAGMNTAGTALASPSVMKFVGSKLPNIKLPGQELVGKFQNRLAGSKPIQAINKLDASITGSKLAQKVSGGLERVGEGIGSGLGKGANKVKGGLNDAAAFTTAKLNTFKSEALDGLATAKDWGSTKIDQAKLWGKKVQTKMHDFADWSTGKLNQAGEYLKGRQEAMGDWLKANGKAKLKSTVKESVMGAGKKAGINQISDFLFDGKFGNFKDIAKDAVEGSVKSGAKEAFKEAKLPDGTPAPPTTKLQHALKVLKDSAIGAGSSVVAKFMNNMMLTGGIGSRAEYLISAIEGGLGGAGGRMSELGSAALLKAVLKDKKNEYLKALAKFGSDSGLKSVFDFGMKNLANLVNGNLFGSAYTWKNLLSGKEIFKVLANGAKFKNLYDDLKPLITADIKRAGRALGEWKTQQLGKIKAGMDDFTGWSKGKINDIKDFAGGKYDAARTKLADITGSKNAPVRMIENPDLLPGEARVIGHGHGETTVEFGPNTSDAVKNAHATTARDLRSANGLPRKVSDRLSELRGRTPTKGGTEKLRLEAEATKHQELASSYREAANSFPEGSPQRQHYEEQAALAEVYAKDYNSQASKTDLNLPDTKGFVETRLQVGRKEAAKRGLPEAPEGYQWVFYENGDLKVVKLDKNLPTKDYVPGKNGEPGEFRIIDESTVPAVKGKSTTEKWGNDRLITDENGQILTLKQKIDDRLQKRAEAQAEVDRIKRLGENLTPEQIADLKMYEQQVREQSRMIGEEAGKSYMASRFPDGVAELIYPKDGVSTSRSGDFDQVWQVKDQNGNTKIIVIEAKGGTSSLGRRRSDKGPGSEYVEQGSKEYFQTITNEMIRSKNSDARSAGNKIADASDIGDIEYLEVRAPIESKAVSLTDGSREFTNTVLDIKITPFLIK